MYCKHVAKNFGELSNKQQLQRNSKNNFTASYSIGTVNSKIVDNFDLKQGFHLPKKYTFFEHFKQKKKVSFFTNQDEKIFKENFNFLIDLSKFIDANIIENIDKKHLYNSKDKNLINLENLNKGLEIINEKIETLELSSEHKTDHYIFLKNKQDAIKKALPQIQFNDLLKGYNRRLQDVRFLKGFVLLDVDIKAIKDHLLKENIFDFNALDFRKRLFEIFEHDKYLIPFFSSTNGIKFLLKTRKVDNVLHDKQYADNENYIENIKIEYKNIALHGYEYLKEVLNKVGFLFTKDNKKYLRISDTKTLLLNSEIESSLFDENINILAQTYLYLEHDEKYQFQYREIKEFDKRYKEVKEKKVCLDKTKPFLNTNFNIYEFKRISNKFIHHAIKNNIEIAPHLKQFQQLYFAVAQMINFLDKDHQSERIELLKDFLFQLHDKCYFGKTKHDKATFEANFLKNKILEKSTTKKLNSFFKILFKDENINHLKADFERLFDIKEKHKTVYDFKLKQKYLGNDKRNVNKINYVLSNKEYHNFILNGGVGIGKTNYCFSELIPNLLNFHNVVAYGVPKTILREDAKETKERIDNISSEEISKEISKGIDKKIVDLFNSKSKDTKRIIKGIENENKYKDVKFFVVGKNESTYLTVHNYILSNPNKKVVIIFIYNIHLRDIANFCNCIILDECHRLVDYSGFDNSQIPFIDNLLKDKNKQIILTSATVPKLFNQYDNVRINLLPKDKKLKKVSYLNFHNKSFFKDISNLYKEKQKENSYESKDTDLAELALSNYLINYIDNHIKENKNLPKEQKKQIIINLNDRKKVESLLFELHKEHDEKLFRFIQAETTGFNEATKENIIKNNKIENGVLVTFCTDYLSEGISLKMENLKEVIFIPTKYSELNHFNQFAGRDRLGVAKISIWNYLKESNDNLEHLTANLDNIIEKGFNFYRNLTDINNVFNAVVYDKKINDFLCLVQSEIRFNNKFTFYQKLNSEHFEHDFNIQEKKVDFKSFIENHFEDSDKKKETKKEISEVKKELLNFILDEENRKQFLNTLFQTKKKEVLNLDKYFESYEGIKINKDFENLIKENRIEFNNLSNNFLKNLSSVKSFFNKKCSLLDLFNFFLDKFENDKNVLLKNINLQKFLHTLDNDIEFNNEYFKIQSKSLLSENSGKVLYSYKKLLKEKTINITKEKESKVFDVFNDFSVNSIFHELINKLKKTIKVAPNKKEYIILEKLLHSNLKTFENKNEEKNSSKNAINRIYKILDTDKDLQIITYLFLKFLLSKCNFSKVYDSKSSELKGITDFNILVVGFSYCCNNSKNKATNENRIINLKAYQIKKVLKTILHNEKGIYKGNDYNNTFINFFYKFVLTKEKKFIKINDKNEVIEHFIISENFF